MINRFTVASLSAMTRTLATVAIGRQPPDYVITGARLLSTYSERILEDREIWIKGGRIAAVKPAGSYPLLPGDHTVRYDAQGGIIAPGLVDPHVNLPASMMSVCAYAETALLNGTTTIICDCLEMANVCGERGISWMLSDARRAPLSVFAKVPGVTLGAPEVTMAIFNDWPEVVALGEKINFLQVAEGDQRSHAVLGEALQRGRAVSWRIYDRDSIAACAASGVTDAQEIGDGEMADECLEAGLWLFLRGGPPGMPWPSLPQSIKTVTEQCASAKRICLCTDDRDAHNLALFGMDWVVRQAVAAGVNPIMAWSMGSLHPATRYAMDNEIGGLGHSRRADLVLLNDDLEVQNTWYGGQLVVESKKITSILDRALSKRYEYPQAAYKTARLPRRLKLVPGLPVTAVIANVVGVAASSLSMEHRQLAIPAARNWAELLTKHQLCFVTVMERDGVAGVPVYGLVQGFGLVDGAVACSVSHGRPCVIVAGTNETDMRLALTTIKELNGGLCAVRGGAVLACVPLPIGGLMSELRARDVAQQMDGFNRVWAELGCTVPFMSFSRLSSGEFQEILVTERGLVLVPEMRTVPLFEPSTDATVYSNPQSSL